MSINTFFFKCSHNRIIEIISAEYADHIDKKENQIFFIFKEIQKGLVAKSYMTSSYMVKYLLISSYIRKPFFIYDFATDPI
jgi:hypothetical protein